MNGRCAFDALSMSYDAAGLMALLIFGLLMASAVAFWVFFVLIAVRLAKHHPAEANESRLHGLAGYVIYAWLPRGRKLGDARLTALLDNFRFLLVGQQLLVALYALALYLGV